MIEKSSRYENSNLEFDGTEICERFGCSLQGNQFVRMNAGYYGIISIWACPLHAKELSELIEAK